MNLHADLDTSTTWEGIKKYIQEAAGNTLKRPTSPMTPRRRKAGAKFQQLKFKLDWDPSNSFLKKELQLARKNKFNANQIHIGDQCSSFFKNLKSHQPGERIQITFKFLSKFKKSASLPKNKTFIPISVWQNDLKSSSIDDVPCLLQEPSTPIQPPPPNPEEIKTYLQNMKNNTAPGNDRLNVELLRHGPSSE